MNRKHTKYINSKSSLVSILTPTFNRPSWLKENLQSLVAQTYPHWECIVVNDFGEDVQPIVAEFRDERIKYFQNQQNLDLAETRNIAISHSSGDYFICLDDDDGLMPESIEFRLWRAKKLNAEIVYSRVLQCFYEKTNSEYKYIGEKIYWDCNYNRDLILVQNIAPVNGIMFSRKAQEAGGLFDKELKTGEDWDHNIAMSRLYPFYETKIIDAYCSYRTDNNQMTGTRNFGIDIAKIFKKWRHTAENLAWVKENQNAILRQMGILPEQYDL